MRKTQFQVDADLKLVRAAGGSRRHLLVRLTAPAADERPRRPLRLVLVLDRSGSMAGEKLYLAREAVIRAISRLQPSDYFSVVCFDDGVEVVVPARCATADAQQDAIRRVRAIDKGGNTDLCGGWRRGCEQLRRMPADDGVRRVILITDGLANRGITDHGEIIQLTAESREQGIITSTIGLGQQFAEQLLAGMADAGGGHFYYVQKHADLPEAIDNEVSESLEVVAQQVELVVRAQAPISIAALGPYPLKQTGPRWSISLCDMVRQQQLSVVLAVDFSSGRGGEQCAVLIGAEDRDGILDVIPERLSFTFATQADIDRQAREVCVDREVARHYAARARCESSRLNGRGEYERSAAVLRKVAARVREYANGDQQLHDIIDELEREASAASQPLDAAELKSFFCKGHGSLKGRDVKGRALRTESASPAPWHLSAHHHRPRVAIFPTSARLHLELREALAKRADALPLRHLQLRMEQLLEETTPAEVESGMLDAHSEARLLRTLPGHASECPRLVFTELALPDHWFSHWHSAQRAAVISTAGWNQLSPLPLGAFLAYELLLHGFRALHPAYDPSHLLHEATRGCIFDLCRQRRDISCKLERAHVCDACRESLARAQAPLYAFYDFCAHIRSLARCA